VARRRSRLDSLALTERCRDRAWILRFLAGRGAAPAREGFGVHVGRCPACRRTLVDLVRGLVHEEGRCLPDPRTVDWARGLVGAAPVESGGIRLRLLPGPRIEGVEGATAPRTADGEARATVASGRFRIDVFAARAGRRWTLRARLAEAPRDAILVLADGRGDRVGAKGSVGSTVGWPALPPGRYRLSALSRDGACDVEIEAAP
jgi:hypothetical protein